MSDERFKALSTDPRYRLPSRKKSQTAVDPRFKRLFTDDGFKNKASVDRYGRKLKSDATASRDIDRRFRLEDEAEDGNSSEESADEEDLELVNGKTRDLAREGFSGSSSEEESSDDEEDIAEDTAGNEQPEGIPMGEVSQRLAVVNLDWDNIRAMDIMAVAQSFVPTGGQIIKTTIYPSEFGRERMDKEETEGPPREIFASSKVHDDEDDDHIKRRLLDEQATDGEEFDSAKLRQYQLERLRYYYAVVDCDGKVTAKSLYDNMDGREYLTTANFFDLRFIPDDTTFDDDAHDECDKLPEGYKPNDFRTEALTHSKVRLTWDNDDTTRKEVQKRAFSRAEMDENDLQAYIGTDSSDADSIASRKSTAEDRKAKKRDAAKSKMRAALGLSDAPTSMSKDDGPVGDMQITFSSGLGSGNKQSVFENEPQDEASTIERYKQQQKERRQKRKEKMKARTNGEEPQQVEANEIADEADPFNDPFFNDPTVNADLEKKARKAKKKAEKEAKLAEEKAAAGRRAELELLMAEDDGSGVQHFDMKEIEKAEKAAHRKGKKSKKVQDDTQAVQDDFKVTTDDPRFKGVFDSHEYAIDPTNPRFKNTQAMKALLEEGRKKRRNEELDELPRSKKKRSENDDVHGLVARLKSRK